MTKTSLAMALSLAVPTLAPAEPPPPTHHQIVVPGQLETIVRVRDAQVAGNEVSGTIVNLTDDELRDVRLRVSDLFMWHNERHPGTDDFSRAEEFVVKGPIPPHGALAFTAPRSPLPLRSDGEFRTSVEVTSLTRQPMTPGAPSAVVPPAATAPPVGTAPSAPPVGAAPAVRTAPPVRTMPPPVEVPVQ